MNQLLYLALLLICPLSMVFMMRGMHGGSSGKQPAALGDAPSAAHVAELEGTVRAHEAAEVPTEEQAETRDLRPLARR